MTIKDQNMAAYYLADCFDGDLFEETMKLVGEWAEARNITEEGGATALTQADKLREEIQEFIEAEDALHATVEFGDMLVLMIIIAKLRGIHLDTALYRAYMKIRHRKGRMENGVFVKEV